MLVMDIEPNKESFLARLKESNFSPSTLIADAQALQEILWYLDEERTREIVTEVLTPEKTTRLEAEQIITNLAKLYPLSKALVMEIMSARLKPKYPDGKTLYSDAEFLEGFDVAKNMRDEIVATFNEVENKIYRLTKEVTDYKRKLENLKADRAALEKQSKALRNIAEERDKVQAQIDQLRIDTDANKLKQQIDDLNVEKNQLESKLAEHKLKMDNRKKNIRDLKAELKNLEQHSDAKEEVRLIKELFKKFPQDAEDGK